MNLESVLKCPICGSGSLQSVEPDIHLCSCVCGFLFDNPRPTLQSISDFYSTKGKYQSWEAKEAPYARLWKRRLKILLHHARKGNLLDIGAGIGQFLATARPFFSDVSGTEISSSGAEVAAEKYGIKLTVGDLQSISLPSDSFDNITLFHILEHVHEPVTMLLKCHDLLRENGILFVCVPNDVRDWRLRLKALGKKIGLPGFEKFSAKSGHVLAGDSSEIHLSHFSPGTLSLCLRKAGFSIETIELDPYFAATWLETIPHMFYLFLHRVLYGLTGTNRYCTILAVAQKTESSVFTRDHGAFEA